MINEAESLSISLADYIGCWVSTASIPGTALALIHSETHCFTFGNQFIMSYATGLATDNLATNMARARPWWPWWRQQHLALAARLKAGILALGHGAQQGCRCNALAIEQREAADV